jgi:hypothetical protein
VTVIVTLLTVAVALLGLLVAGLLRSHAEILRALHEAGVGLDPNAAPRDLARGPLGRTGDGTAIDIAGVDAAGASVQLAVGAVPHRTLLAFLSSTCLTCREFWSAFADPDLDVPADARLVVVTQGPEAESPSSIRKLAPRDVRTVLSSDAWRAYGVPGAPYFVLVDGPRGEVVGEGAATSWPQVRNLIEQALADSAERGAGARNRHARVDDELRAAGIEPGDPRLYPGATS